MTWTLLCAETKISDDTGLTLCQNKMTYDTGFSLCQDKMSDNVAAIPWGDCFSLVQILFV